MDEVLTAAAMVAALLLHLGILHGPCQVHHKLFSKATDTVTVLSLWALFV